MDVPFAQLRLDNQLCFALYDASRAVVRAYTPVLADLGLTYPQYLTMLVLWENDGPVSMGDLGSRLHLDSGTLTPLLKRLTQLGLVERQRDSTDERRVLVSLTTRGAALRSKACDVPARIFGQFDLDVDAARNLQRDLNRLVDALESNTGARAS